MTHNGSPERLDTRPQRRGFATSVEAPQQMRRRVIAGSASGHERRSGAADLATGCNHLPEVKGWLTFADPLQPTII